MADDVYSRLDAGPIAAAHLIRDLRSQWGIEQKKMPRIFL